MFMQKRPKAILTAFAIMNKSEINFNQASISSCLTEIGITVAITCTDIVHCLTCALRTYTSRLIIRTYDAC